jgi:Cu/Ag efflux pump CusA
MLSALIEASLRNRLFVLVAAALVFVYGALVLRELPVDVFPDLNRPLVSVLTEAPGLAPEEVELLVTLPLETSVNGAPGVRRVRSSSGVGLSIVFVEFDWGSDLYLSRQLVQERVQLAAQALPPGVLPVLGPVSSIMGEILLIGISSQGGRTAPMDLRTLADWTLRPRLLTLAGVAQVIPIGGGVKQVQVLADPARMAAYGVTLGEVTLAAERSQVNTAGGFLEADSREVLIRNIARTADPELIASSVVSQADGVPIRLRDVADVQYGRQVMRGDASVNAEPAVIVSVHKQPGMDTIELTERVEAALAELRGALPPDVELQVLFKQSRFIEAAIANVEEALRDGALMVVPCCCSSC